MKMDRDERIIKKALNTVHTPEYNINRAVQNEIQRPRRSIYFKRIIPITSVIVVMLVFSVGVSAAYIPSFNNLLSIVSPKVALMLQPIEKSSENAGIKMEVVAAMTDEEMSVIYVTMQDLTSNRIDQTIDLFDDYSLTGAKMFNSQLVDYDENAKKATFRIQANGGDFLSNKKVSFQINSFLSHKKTFNNVKVDTNLTQLKQKTPQTMFLDLEHSSGGGGELVEKLQGEKVKILQPFETEISLPEINFMHISNIGFIDERLHIQTKWEGKDMDNHGYFYLVDPLGNKIFPSSISFGMDDSGQVKYGSEMEEYIFETENLDVSKLTLMGDFVASGLHTKGDWSTTFKVQPVKEEKVVQLSKDFGTWTADRMTISPLGVTLEGNGKSIESTNPSVKIKMKDGSLQELDSAISYSENENVKLKYVPDLPFELSKIKSVVIDNTEIDL
ncbi:DUF4179 domain-containing protein [Bacillus sp. JJ722]|uniref:DUF4179 domain-containing protein n=1 Tax=Bacillus sp. JJ722 TaxID=3122973 RepID=UPI002FFE762A